MTNPRPAEPLFIISLPRSGSTLLQRVLLSAQDSIIGAGESWVLPALLDMDASLPGLSSYGTQWARLALKENRAAGIVSPQGLTRIAHSVMTTHVADVQVTCGTPQTRYVIEKTPRNTLYLDQIAEAFADKKVIFLWRHPLQIAASVINTWSRPRGSFNLYSVEADFFVGLPNMIQYRKRFTNALDIDYSQLVNATGDILPRLERFLALDPSTLSTANLTMAKAGQQIGDQTGATQWSSVQSRTEDEWKATFRSPIKKAWALRLCRALAQTPGADERFALHTLKPAIKELGIDPLASAIDLAKALRQGAGHLALRRYLRFLGQKQTNITLR